MKKFLLTFFVVTFFMSAIPVTGVYAAEKEIKVTMNGVAIKAAKANEAPIMKDGRALVSIRHLKAAIPDVKIGYESKHRKATVIQGGTLIEVYLDKSYILINGVKVTMDTKPVVKEGVTFLPARYIAEGLGYRVEWDGKAPAVHILTAATNNFERYGLVAAEEFPVTVTSDGFSVTYHKMMIYPYDSPEGQALVKKYSLTSRNTPEYLIDTKITLVNNSKKTIRVDASNTDKLYLGMGWGKFAYPMGTDKKELFLEHNSEKYLMFWKLAPNESLMTNEVFAYYGDSFDYLNVGVRDVGSEHAVVNVAQRKE